MSNPHRPSPSRRRSAGLLACAPLLLGLVAGATTPARAGSSSASSGGTDGGTFARRPFTLTIDNRFGYDDNTLAVERGKDDSAFINTNIAASYATRDSRTSLSIGANTGYTYYFDRPGREYDPNVGLSIGLTYKLTPRATLALSNYSVYQAEPDLGVVGIQGRRNGDYFYTTNNFSVAYRFAPRVSTVSSYSPSFFVYREEPYSFFQDRAEHYFAQSVRFLVQPRLTLSVEYRFGYIQYFNERDATIFDVPVAGGTLPVFVPDYHSDSYTHFALVGLDYALGPRFRLGLRAGAQFRNYAQEETFSVDNGIGAFSIDRLTIGTVLGPNSRIRRFERGAQASPYVEGTLTYNLNRRGTLTLVSRYGLEEADVAVSNTSRDTFRIGLNYDQAITARIGGYIGFNYSNSGYTNADPGNNFDENVYDVALGLRYVVNRHVAVEVGYSHTTVSSEFSTRVTEAAGGANNFSEREYHRNRYFAGVRFAF